MLSTHVEILESIGRLSVALALGSVIGFERQWRQKMAGLRGYFCKEMTMRSATKRRDYRLEVRLTPKPKSILKRAASVERKTVSAFILDKGLEAAAETLAARSEFRLSAKQYDAFVAALDTAKPRPRLEALLKTPSVLE